MNKQISAIILIIILFMGILIQTTQATEFTEPVPLPQLGSDTYLGRQGGLYPNGANTPPASYVSNQIQPAYDSLLADDQIVVLCLGMSNLTHTCNALINKVLVDSSINPAVKIVNAGQPGRAQQAWDGNISATDGVWVNANKRLTQASETPATVDVVIYFNAWAFPDEPDFETQLQTVQGSLSITMESIATLYPNTQLIYVTSREYAGFVVTDLNPDPWAYWDGFAFKQLVENRINNVTDGPPLLWTAYQYDPTWPEFYFKENDGVHLTDEGLDASSQLWLDFFKTEPWFGSGIAPGPTATPTATPLATPIATPTATPLATPNLDEQTYLPFLMRAP